MNSLKYEFVQFIWQFVCLGSLNRDSPNCHLLWFEFAWCEFVYSTVVVWVRLFAIRPTDSCWVCFDWVRLIAISLTMVYSWRWVRSTVNSFTILNFTLSKSDLWILMYYFNYTSSSPLNTIFLNHYCCCCLCCSS